MSCSNFRKSLLPSIALASALSLAGGARAADLASDAQAQARELLAPTKALRLTTTLPPASRGTDAAVDPQELARRLLTGPRSLTEAPRIATRALSHSHSDGQALAQRMILGAGAG